MRRPVPPVPQRSVLRVRLVPARPEPWRLLPEPPRAALLVPAP
jgi:hypothetical protein